MKNCREFENSLPLYLDNLLSGTEKTALEEHLKSCRHCSKSLAQLKETGRLVKDLGEVEPPPWFKQKVMTKVRKEAEKESFVKKWFYPLRIKIPVQIFATVVIAVLAVYIYRSGEEQIKDVMPSSAPALVMEVSKSQMLRQKQEVQKADMNKKAAGAARDNKDEKTIKYEMSSDAEAPMAKKLKKELSQENVGKGKNYAVKETADHISPDIKTGKYASAPAAKYVEASPESLEKKKDNLVAGYVLKSGTAMQAQEVSQKVHVALHVADINNADADVESLLAKYGSKNIIRQMPAGKVVLTAELKNQSVKDFITHLKSIGWTEEIVMPVDSTEGNITIIIDILNK